MLEVAIVGGGNGGYAAAVDLTLKGASVRLWGRSEKTLSPVVSSGGLRYTGVLGEGYVPITRVTTDLEAAVVGADLVMVCLPAPAFPDVAKSLASLLTPEQPVLLNPGSTGGALIFRRALMEAGQHHPTVIGETNTLTYICRKLAPDLITITNRIDNALAAALPASGQAKLEPILAHFYPNMTWVESVLTTSLSNLNAVLHPPGVVLGAAWIEATGGDFTFYYDAATPAVARVMSDLDRERMAIANAYGYKALSLLTLFSRIGSTLPVEQLDGSYLKALKGSAPNREIRAPSSLDHRYLTEDTPYGLVPMEALARAAGVATPVLSALVDLGSSMSGQDLRGIGIDAAALGIADRNVESIRRMVEGE